MSRDDGFAVADVCVNLYDDDKVKQLYRELGGDLGRMGHAMMLCEAALLASWRDGHRRTVHEAAPIWMTVDDELVAVLVRVGLLDRGLRRPVKSWNTWFGPAHDRREARRDAGRIGGLRARGKRSIQDALEKRDSTAISTATASQHPTGRQAGPSVRPIRPNHARRAGDTVQGTNGKNDAVPLSKLVSAEALAAAGRKS